MKKKLALGLAAIFIISLPFKVHGISQDDIEQIIQEFNEKPDGKITHTIEDIALRLKNISIMTNKMRYPFNSDTFKKNSEEIRKTYIKRYAETFQPISQPLYEGIIHFDHQLSVVHQQTNSYGIDEWCYTLTQLDQTVLTLSRNEQLINHYYKSEYQYAWNKGWLDDGKLYLGIDNFRAYVYRLFDPYRLSLEELIVISSLLRPLTPRTSSYSDLKVHERSPRPQSPLYHKSWEKDFTSLHPLLQSLLLEERCKVSPKYTSRIAPEN